MTFFSKTRWALIFALMIAHNFHLPSCRGESGPEFFARPEDVAQKRKFSQIWEQRFDKDVSAELLPFMDDLGLQERAVRALGRVEKIGVLPELEKRRDAQNELLEKARIDPSVRVNDVLDFDTAIARIKSRELHGKAKVEFVLRNMKPSWTWEEAIAWSTKLLNDPHFYLEKSDQEIQSVARPVRDIVDLLYTMSKNGEDIEPLRKQFTFSKAQNVQLDGAKLSPSQEAEYILDYSQTLDTIHEDDEYVCESHLLSLGEPARVALKKRMQMLLQTKPKFTNANPFMCLLRAAAITRDNEFSPLLESFQATMNYVKGTKYDAQQARRRLIDKTAYSFAPQ